MAKRKNGNSGRPPSVGDEIEWWPLETIKPYDRNSRTHDDDQVEAIRKSIAHYGWTTPALIDEDGTIIAGHARIEAAKLAGWTEAKVIVARGWSEAKKRAYVIADNQLALRAGWADDILKSELHALKADDTFDMSLLGFEEDELESLLLGEVEPKRRLGSLADRFGVPPFTVLNAREGWWQDRKRGWLALGIQSELGRGHNGSDKA